MAIAMAPIAIAPVMTEKILKRLRERNQMTSGSPKRNMVMSETANASANAKVPEYSMSVADGSPVREKNMAETKQSGGANDASKTPYQSGRTC